MPGRDDWSVRRGDEFDERRWVRVEGVEGRCTLGYNPHTFVGRMGVQCPDGEVLYISKSDVLEASDLAWAWIDGFLAGNAPPPSHQFGPSIHEAGDEDERLRRWREAVYEFRASGAWPHEEWRRLIPFAPGTELPAFTWTLQGDEVWEWADGQWRCADPQPQRDYKLLVGTLCHERGHCDLAAGDSAHAVCVDCGASVEVVPEAYSLEEWETERLRYGSSLDP